MGDKPKSGVVELNKKDWEKLHAMQMYGVSFLALEFRNREGNGLVQLLVN